jgi:hypothetical protein
MGTRKYRRVRDRVDPRTPVAIQADVYEWARLTAKSEERSITNFVNMRLRQVMERESGVQEEE